MDTGAELLEAIEQDLLGDVLRNHQGVWIFRWELIEPDRHKLAIPIANAEPGSVDTKPGQSLRYADPLEHLEGPGMDDRGTRRVCSCRLALDDRDVMAMTRQRGGNRQPNRTRTHDQYLCSTRKLTHHALLR